MTDKSAECGQWCGFQKFMCIVVKLFRDGSSYEAKYLREALDMIDEFQSRSSRRESATQETTEVILVDRPQ